MKKIFLFFFMAAISLFAMAQSTVQVSNVTDLRAALKNPSVTTVQLTTDMPDDETIGEYCYNASGKNIIGKKILDLNGHAVYASAYTMLYTALTDTLVITGNGTWNCDSPNGFYLGEDEAEAVSAGVLIFESGSFIYKDSYSFITFGWSSSDYLPQTQVIVNGGTFYITNNYGNFIYSSSTQTGSSGKKPKVTINGGFFKIGGLMFRVGASDIITVNGGSFLYTGSYSAAPFESGNTKLGSGKVAYIGGQAFSGSTLDYEPNESTLEYIDYYTTFQVGDASSDFVEVNLKSSSDGKAGLEVATNKSYYPTSGKFLKNSPFSLKALAMPNYGKDFNGWGEVKNASLEDPTEEEVEFSIGEKNISMKAFFGSNMPTDFYVDGVHYYITFGDEVKIGSGEEYSGDGLVAGYKGGLTIPATVTYNSKTYKVVSIADYACYGHTGLTDVDTESSANLNNIGAYAFGNCTNLQSVWFDDTELWYFGEGAFYNCSSLYSFWLEDNYIYTISDYCFYGCTSLQSFLAWNGWEWLNSIGNYAFYGCTALEPDNYYAPWDNGSVTMIGEKAFANCGFTHFTVPTSVNQIDTYAFNGCSLDYVLIPDPNSLTMFSSSIFPTNTKVLVPCDMVNAMTNPMWYEVDWNLQGYNASASVSAHAYGALDNENGSEGTGKVDYYVDCQNTVHLFAQPTYSSRFAYWSYGDQNYYDASITLPYTEYMSPIAYFASPQQVIAKMEYATEDGSAVPSDFGGVSFYLNKQGESEKEYKGPSVWRKCELYDPEMMSPDYDYINLTAKVGNVNDYRYEFVKWANNNATTAATTIAVDQDIVLKAIIRELPKYTCTVSADPTQGGSVTLVYGENVTSKQEYKGQPVRFYATPKTGWEFSHWDNDLTNTNTTLEVLNLSKDEAHVAHFKREVTLSFGPKISGTGTVTASPASSGNKYWSGTKVKLTATPATNYEFTRWVDDGTTNPEREITVGYENATYTAVFTQQMATVNVTIVPAGSATVSGAGSYALGSIVNLSYEAAEGYEFKSWQREGYSLVEEDGDFDFIANDKTINITLTMQEKKPAQPLTIKLSCTQGAPMTEDLLARFIDFSVYPMEYEFVKWDEDNNLVMQGHYPYGTEVSIEYFASKAYSFVRWENNETEFDREITMDDAKTLTMYIKPRKWDFEVIAYDNKGTVTADKTYFYFNDIFTSDPDYEWSLTLTATPKSGYTFLGWGDPNLPIAFGEVYDWFDGRYANIEEYFADMQAYYALVQAKEERTDDEEVAYQYIKMLLTPSQTLSKEQVRMLADDNMELDYEDHIARVAAFFTVATGVENVSEGSIGAEKTLRDGILLIQRNGKLYNAQGKLVR